MIDLLHTISLSLLKLIQLMQATINFLDIGVILAYLYLIVHCSIKVTKNQKRTTRDYSVANRSIGGTALGLSIFATYISNMGFLAMPGKAYTANWSYLVMHFTIPLALILCLKFVVPIYRKSNDICSYTQLGRKYGQWASVYASTLFIIINIVRMAMILYLVSLTFTAISGVSQLWTLLIGGIFITLYTCFGGIRAVISTDIIQAYSLLLGAIIIAGFILIKMPGGISQIIEIGLQNQKFSLGDFSPSLKINTFWIVLMSGFIWYFESFSLDQQYVARIFSAKSTSDAKKGLIIGSILLVISTALFYFLGTSLYAFYKINPGNLDASISLLGNDAILPFFIIHELPNGLKGLLLVAIIASAMSSVDSIINSVSTTLYSEIYSPLLKKSRPPSDTTSISFLRLTSLIGGVLAILMALNFNRFESILDGWIEFCTLLSGASLGLFAMQLIAKKTTPKIAIYSSFIGLCFITWLVISTYFPHALGSYASPFSSLLSEFLVVLVTIITSFLLIMLKQFKKKLPGSIRSSTQNHPNHHI